MNSLFIAVFVAIFAAAVLLIARNLFTSKQQKTSKKIQANGQQPASVTTHWRAVKISPGLICCNAVHQYEDQTLLAKEAPRLPLAECDQKECRCKYIHLDDRRSGDERRVELGDLGAFLPANHVERRASVGRRETDLAA